MVLRWGCQTNGVRPWRGRRYVCHNTMGARAAANRPPSRAVDRLEPERCSPGTLISAASGAGGPADSRRVPVPRSDFLSSCCQLEEPQAALFQSMDPVAGTPGLAARKRRVDAVPAQNAPKSDRPQAKTPMNRRKSPLRRRAAPNYETGSRHHSKTDLCASVTAYYTIYLFHRCAGPVPPGGNYEEEPHPLTTNPPCPPIRPA